MFQLVLPEYFMHVLFCVLFLIGGEWVTVLLNAPLIAYHANRYDLMYVVSKNE